MIIRVRISIVVAASTLEAMTRLLSKAGDTTFLILHELL